MLSSGCIWAVPVTLFETDLSIFVHKGGLNEPLVPPAVSHHCSNCIAHYSNLHFFFPILLEMQLNFVLQLDGKQKTKERN